jgi:hypothetical protein
VTVAVLSPPLGDLETIVAAIAAALSGPVFADLLAAVDIALNLRDADGNVIATPAPAAVYGYERAELEAYPAAEIIGVETVYDPQADEAAGTHRIGIDWTQLGDNEQTVTRDVQRLVLATRLFFRRNLIAEAAVALGIGPVLIESEGYGRLARAETAGNPLVKSGHVVLAVSSWSA